MEMNEEFKNRRKRTNPVRVGNVPIGAGSPVVVQSMTNTRSEDPASTLEQIKRLHDAGCELVRVAIPNEEAAKALRHISEASPIPVIADIHFDHRLALAAIDSGAAKIRINPGNIGDHDKLALIAKKAKKAGIPIRVGINAGSLPKPRNNDKLEPVDRMVTAALEYCELFESLDFRDLVVSVKSSGVMETIAAYRAISGAVDYPLHLGVTEAGSLVRASVKSAVAFGVLLDEGIGDTIRVSITGDPIEEVKVAYQILSALDLRHRGPDMVSCPTCGRCEIDLAALSMKVEKLLEGVTEPIKVAVMGCAVNGPGEARSADIGIAGGHGRGNIFVRGETVRSVDENELLDAFVEELAAILQSYRET